MVDYLTLKTGFAGSVNAERLATQAGKTVSIVDTRNRIGGNGIVCEYPQADADSYYPVPPLENAEFYNKYQALADAAPGVCFVGRLAAYRYSNTDRSSCRSISDSLYSHYYQAGD
ncbi:UDP-galactopyranose mutase [Tychonema sp. LEGE 07203]|uniref:UDP-galactopyranose mutase n=1 Tax=Tychonema sp. LEGE 07203 TaxID=1828671 RepID=UPI001D133370|nr:UDP-galactopyranose mutase [Tychonema sp. LEGE 07203]